MYAAIQRLIGAANIPVSGLTGSGSGCTVYLLITITRSGISVIRPNQNVAAPNPVFSYAGYSCNCNSYIYDEPSREDLFLIVLQYELHCKIYDKYNM